MRQCLQYKEKFSLLLSLTLYSPVSFQTDSLTPCFFCFEKVSHSKAISEQICCYASGMSYLKIWKS